MTPILLADDDVAFGFTVKEELEQRGFSVDLVHNGVEAVLNCMDKPYACILMDGQMPRLHGVDALRIIKKVNPGIPAILISGFLESPEISEFVECTGAKCMAKPFEMAHLEKEIRNSISNPG